MWTQKSFVLKPSEKKSSWHLIDAQGQTVGKLAAKIAQVLRGKNNPQYTPHTDSGDFVVVVNCEKVVFSGNKELDKRYYWHTNHVGGLKSRTVQEQRQKHPEQILYEAVKGMLPKTTLGRKQLTKLKLFVGGQHTHQAQMPAPLAC